MAPMMRLLNLCLFIASLSGAQQFPFYKYSYETLPNLSNDCISALNETLDCSDWLFAKAASFSMNIDIMNEAQLEAVCVESCKASLEKFRSSIQSACDSSNDLMVKDSMAFPATYMIDRYIYSYDMSCYKDRDTGGYCDLVIGEWRNETSNSTASHDCEDCILGPWKIQLEHPVAYDEDLAEDFASLTSSCGATGYSYSSPPPYGSRTSTSASTTASPEPEPSCDSKYTVAAGDTCHSIAANHNVSNYGLIDSANLDIFCKSLKPGESVCIPPPCKIHKLDFSETCKSLGKKYGVSKVQLVSWNANLDPLCLNIERWRGDYLCVGPPGGTSDPEPMPEPTQVPVPGNASPDSNEKCSKWYTVVEGDYCGKLTLDWGITMEDLLFLNSGLNEDCTNLQLKVAYCVAPVGDIATYPGYSGGPSTSFPRPPTATTTFNIPTETLNPKAPGTIDDCIEYANHYNTSKYTEYFTYQPWIEERNSCHTIAGKYKVSITDLIIWNPSLKEGDCKLAEGYSYCVKKEEEVTSTYVPPTSTTPPPDTTVPSSATDKPAPTTSSDPTPSPTQPGTIDTCKKYHFHDENDGGCDGIAKKYNLSLSDFHKWNPEVGEDCTALWLKYYVCVGV